MKVFGELEAAQAERLAADPVGVGLVEGRIWFNTTDNVLRLYNGTSIVELGDLQTAQTFQNATLEGAVISDYLEFDQQGSTPANPAAGKNRIYFKNDGTAYTLASDGTELPLGSGSGGSKNYFEDADAKIDSNIGAWETDDGVGGSSAGLTLALTAVAGELLEGTNSLKLTKDAADRNGHFIKVLSKTIDPSDRGRPNYGSFSFRPLAGYVSGDLIFELYDVTNAAVLYSGPAEALELINSQGRFGWVSYLSETTAQVEFRVKVNNTNTNAFDAVFDEFTFGPVARLQTQGLKNEVYFQGTTTVASNTDVTIPIGTIHEDKQGLLSGNAYIAPRTGKIVVEGLGSFGNSSTAFRSVNVFVNGLFVARPQSHPGNSSTNTVHSFFTVLDVNAGDSITMVARQATGSNENVTFITHIYSIGLEDNNVVSENELGLLKSSGRYEGLVTNSFTTGSFDYNHLYYPNTSYEKGGISYNPANGQATILKTGVYNLQAGVNVSFSAALGTADAVWVGFIKNGVSDVHGGQPLYGNGSSTNFTVSTNTSLFLTAGETILAYQRKTGTLGISAAGDARANYFTIERQADLTVIGAASDQNYFDSGELTFPSTVSWNAATPGGSGSGKMRWFQRGKIVDFFFWFDYTGAPASNTFCFFDLPAGLPIPSTQTANSTQTSHAGSAHVGNGGSIGTPASCQFLNSTGRVYVVTNGAVSSNEVHGHLRYYID